MMPGRDVVDNSPKRLVRNVVQRFVKDTLELRVEMLPESVAPAHEILPYIVMGFAPTRYGVALVTRASERPVVNVAQQGGMCAVMVSAKALHGTADATTLGGLSGL